MGSMSGSGAGKILVHVIYSRILVGAPSVSQAPWISSGSPEAWIWAATSAGQKSAPSFGADSAASGDPQLESE